VVGEAGQAETLIEQAQRHQAAGEPARARACYEAALAMQGGRADWHNDLACLLVALGETEGALEHFEAALAIRPAFFAPARNLALLLAQTDAAEAERHARNAVRIDPNAADLHLLLAELLRRSGRHAEALASCMQAVQARPDFAEAHNDLGNSHKHLGDRAAAVAAYRRAVQLKPALAAAHLNLGGALLQEDRWDEAESHFREALARQPSLAEAALGVGYTSELRGERTTAMENYRRAIELQPDLAEAHFNLALQLLAAGDWKRGWHEYEWRWRLAEVSAERLHPPGPLWDGSSLAGRTLLLYTEQGFGDSIQFVRFASLLSKQAREVILRCPDPLVRLFQSLEGIRVVRQGDPLPPYDLRCPLLSVPGMLGTTAASVPAGIPYLFADPQAADTWASRMADGASELRVGLAWASDPNNFIAKLKSLQLSDLQGFGGLPVTFYSLQKGAGADQAGDPPPGMRIVDLARELRDFADTAALVANLDLVITIDTAVAHLAGAMGKPVWTFVHFPAVWRWMPESTRTRWYPTMRLYRQRRPHEWTPVLEQATQDLSDLCARGGRGALP
jgi:tetratricopeptide (TPR) repeat protein